MVDEYNIATWFAVVVDVVNVFAIIFVALTAEYAELACVNAPFANDAPLLAVTKAPLAKDAAEFAVVNAEFAKVAVIFCELYAALACAYDAAANGTMLIPATVAEVTTVSTVVFTELFA
mgnify:CR=1 FL=1